MRLLCLVLLSKLIYLAIFASLQTHIALVLCFYQLLFGTGSTSIETAFKLKIISIWMIYTIFLTFTKDIVIPMAPELMQ